MPDDTESSASSSRVGPLRGKRTRTHARRSCLSCRRNKTKCSLPNLDVTSSMSPQKLELSCERCKALGINCIVWDGDRKSKRYTQLGASNSAISDSTRRHNLETITNPGKEHQAVRGHGIVSAFILCEPDFRATSVTQQKDPEEETTAPSTVGDLNGSQLLLTSPNAQVYDSDQGYVIRFADLRTRPMHLFCSLLAKHGRFNGVLSDVDGNERLDILYEDVISQIEAKYRLDYQEQDLVTLHCHLPTLKSIVKSQRQSRSISAALLTCLMMLLSNLDLHHAHVRHLVMMIRHYGRQVLLHAPRCIEAAQSLELLSVHLPSILESSQNRSNRDGPLDPDCPSLGAGLIGQAQQIIQCLPSQESRNDKIGDGQHPFDRMYDIRLSLQTWSLLFQLQDRGVFDVSRCEHNIPALQRGENDDARQKGRVALRHRARYVLNASEASVGLSQLANNHGLSIQQFKLKQSAILTKLAASTDVGEQERKATQKMGSDYQNRRFDSLWTWLDLESNCLLQISIARSITSVLRKIFARSSGRDPGFTSTKRPLVFETISKLWRDADWADYVWKLAHQRRKIVVSFLARLSNFVSSAAVPMSTTCFPMPSLCAWAISAAFTLVDEYAIVLQLRRCKVEELDTHIALLHQCAGALGLLSSHMVIEGSLIQDFENVKCTSLAVRAIATTLSTWQDKHTTFLSTLQGTENTSTRLTHEETSYHTTEDFNFDDLLAQCPKQVCEDALAPAEGTASFDMAQSTLPSESYTRTAIRSMDWADVIHSFFNGSDDFFPASMHSSWC